jgi:hypothetical protein
MSNLSPSQRAKKYNKALAYLDHCGPFDEEKLRKANNIAGTPLTEADIQKLIRTAPLMLTYGGKSGGMEGVKEELRKSLQEGLDIFSSLGAAGVGGKSGCLSVIAILAIPVIVFVLS